MKKILIIEDDLDLIETVSVFLQSNGYIVYMANDGMAGVEEAQKVIPDLIICDIAMPKLDGYGVFEKLRSMKETEFIPFIFLTAKIEIKDIRTGMNLGADDYITKPFDNYELLNAIKVRLNKYETYNQHTEDKILALIDNPLTGVFIFQNKKIVYTNEKLCQLLEITNNNLVNSGIENFVHYIATPDDKKKVIEYFQNTVRKKNTDPIKIKTTGTNEKKTDVELFIKMFLYHGKEAMACFVIERESGNDQVISPEIAADLECISQREKEVLLLICQGLVNKEIADRLCISKRTVDRHRDSLMKKTHSRNTAELMIHSMKFGLLDS